MEALHLYVEDHGAVELDAAGAPDVVRQAPLVQALAFSNSSKNEGSSS